LIDRDGKPAGSFGSRVDPLASELTAEIEKLLTAEIASIKK
jgi:hypothetical protein